jgi:periplasmic protein TonB
MKTLLFFVLLGGGLGPLDGVAQVQYAPPVRKTAPEVAPDTVMVPDLSGLGDAPIDPPAAEDERVYTYVEQMPVFPGGPGELARFLTKHYRKPPPDRNSPSGTKLHVRFIVDKTGAVRDPEILQGISALHDAEALRVVRLLPRFQPGRQNDRPMNVYYTAPLIIDAK